MFGLSHGFPHWFSTERSPRIGHGTRAAPDAAVSGASVLSPTPPSSGGAVHSSRVTVIDILRYLRSAFDSVALLDSIPLSAAVNVGAWHAWQAHRSGQRPKAESNSTAASGHGLAAGEGTLSGRLPPHHQRSPSEWNWNGVWEERVRRGVENSTAESVLYGRTGSKKGGVCISLFALTSIRDGQSC